MFRSNLASNRELDCALGRRLQTDTGPSDFRIAVIQMSMNRLLQTRTVDGVGVTVRSRWLMGKLGGGFPSICSLLCR